MTKERYLPAKGIREINVMGIKKSIWCESETYINFWQMTIKWLEDKNHTLKQQKKKIYRSYDGLQKKNGLEN